MRKLTVLLSITVVITLIAPRAEGAQHIFANSATRGPDLVHDLNKDTGALIRNFTVSTGNGRDVVVFDGIIYSTEAGPSGNIFGGSNKIYKTDLNTGAQLGSITVTGLPSGRALSALSWDGRHFWAIEYSGTNVSVL